MGKLTIAFIVLSVMIGVVLVGVVGALVATSPFGARHYAAAGKLYWVGDTARRLPDTLTFSGPAPLLLRPCVLAAQLSHIKVVTAAFDAAGIPYWLTCGSLLGALRHHGMIPWDDDTDVQVPLQHMAAVHKMCASMQWTVVPAGGGLKIAPRASKIAYPFVDVIFVQKHNDMWRLAFPLSRTTGKPTWGKAAQWPRECFAHSDIFPLTRVPFEDTHVWVPRNAMTCVLAMYGPDCMTTVKSSARLLHIWNHRNLMVLVATGLVPRRVI